MVPNKITCEVSGSQNGKAILLDRVLSNFLMEAIYFLLWPLAILSIINIGTYYFASFSVSTNQFYLGLSFLVLAIFLIFSTLLSFLEKKLKKGSLEDLNSIKQKLSAGKEVNLFDILSFDLAKTLGPVIKARKADEISIKEIGQALFSAKDINFFILRLGVSPDEITDSFEESSHILIDLLSKSVDIAITNGHSSAWSGDLLLALTDVLPKLKALWSNFGIERADLESLVSWQTKIYTSIEKNRGLFNPSNLKLTGGVGRDWTFGYTIFLTQYSADLTEAIERTGLGLEVIGRDKEIEQMNEAMSKKSAANVLLVGDAGVGKHTTILGFAKRMIEGDAAAEIRHDNIFQVNTEMLISGATNDGEIVGRFSQILNEASSAGNIIILIENIDTLFSADGVGTTDVSSILLPYLEGNAVHIIGTCEINAYNKYVLSNSALSSHFVRVSVDQPKAIDLIRILEDTAPLIESRTGSIITYEAIKTTVKEAEKYLINATEPERSIGLLEGVATRATTERGKTLVLDKDVEEYLAEKLKLPTTEANQEEKEKLLNLEAIMHKDVIGQDVAIKSLADAMRRNRAQISDSRKPIGSFLFLGPTGVGKTATAKALAKAYFGKSSNMIRFDMSEYQNKADIYRLIGTKTEPGNLTTFISENPFSLLLFDEVEKADPDILNLFLQILDEGILTDGRDQKIIFTNAIIIATSNAGSDLISQSVNSGEDYEKTKANLNNQLITEHIFKPEFINRFAGVIVFTPLSREAIKEVASLIIGTLAQTILAKQGVTVDVDPGALEVLAELGYDPKMGARPMERVVQDKIENLLANKILRSELKKGDKITITKEMIS